jgi:hypothetical protein
MQTDERFNQGMIFLYHCDKSQCYMHRDEHAPR